MCFKKKLNYGVRLNKRKVPNLPSDMDFNRALNIFVDEVSKEYDEDNVKKALNKAVIEWWDYVAPSPSTGNLSTVVIDEDKAYSGLTKGKTCKVAWRGKLWRSAFAHELLHIICIALVQTDGDPNHSNDRLWKVLEVRINKKLQEEAL